MEIGDAQTMPNPPATIRWQIRVVIDDLGTAQSKAVPPERDQPAAGASGGQLHMTAWTLTAHP